MTKGIALILSAGAGALVAMQPPINSKLGQAIGNFTAATVSFLVGTLALLVVTVAVGGSNVGAIRDVPWWYFVGGFIGAVFVASSLITVRTLGAGGVVAATLCGQLVVSAVLDRAGVLGLEATALTPERVLGFVLLIAGTLLVVLR